MLLTFLGDVNIGGDVSRAVPDHPPHWFWGDTLPLLQQVDGVIANLECPVTDRQEPWDETFKAVLMRADPAAVPILTAANIRAVALANNHTLDQGRDGAIDTLAALAEEGIAGAGAGADAAAAMKPAMFEVGGIMVGLLSATDNMPWFAATPSQPGLNHLNFYTGATVRDRVAHWVEAARADGAEIVVLSLHWGPNYRLMPPKRFQRFARMAIDLGVSVVHGHSAHVAQPVELYGGGIILYDTGDALDDYWRFFGYSNNWSWLFETWFDGPRFRGLRLWPICLQGSPPIRRATLEESIPMKARLIRRSDRLGTTFIDEGESLVLDIER